MIRQHRHWRGEGQRDTSGSRVAGIVGVAARWLGLLVGSRAMIGNLRLRRQQWWISGLVVVGLVCVVFPAGLAGARGSGRGARGGAPAHWPVAPRRGVLVSGRELARLRASARRSGRRVELGRLRGRRSRTFVAPGGGLTRTFFARGGGLTGEVTWGAGGSGLLARLVWGGASLELGFGADTIPGPGAGVLPGPAFDGLTARYRSVAPGVDLKAQGDGEGFEQRIVIARRPRGGVAFRFPVRLRGLRGRVAAKGVVEFVDARGGVVAKGLPGREAGAQTDPLTGEPTKTGAVVSRVVAGPGGGQALEVVPDQSFLRDANVRYPVTVDTGAIGVVSTPSRGSAPVARSAGSAQPSFDPCTPGTTHRPSSGVDGGVYAAGDPCLPGAPTDVAATGFNEKLLVSWGAPVDGGPPLSYSVTAHRASDGSVLASRTVSAGFSPSAEFTFRDGVANGAGYYVDVVASNDAGDGSGASSATVTPAAAPWSQSDTLGGSNPSEPAVTCRSSWGVDCGTGNFSYSHTDLSVPGRGVALALTSTYNSQNDSFQPSRGKRWVTNYDMSVESAGTSTRIVHQENGSTVYFFDDGNGGWHAEGGAQATLTRNAGDGTYTFKRTHALTGFRFNSNGTLASMSDRNGYVTTVDYAPGTSRVSRVTDPAGRSLTFTYDANQKLSQVSDPAGRQVVFAFDAIGRLTRLTDAAGGATTFAYAEDPDPNHREYHLVQVTRPNGNVQSNAYDGAALSYSTGGPSGRTMF